MKRLSRNLLAIAASDVVRRVLGFFTIAYLARHIRVEEFGAMNLGFTILSYALMLSSGGLVTLGARDVAGGKSALIGSIFSLRILGSAAAYAMVVTVAMVVVTDIVTARFAMVLCLSLFVHAFLLDWYFQGREEMGKIGVARLLSAVTYLLVVITFVRSSGDLLWVAAGAIAGDLVSAIILGSMFIRQPVPVKVGSSMSGWRDLLSQSFTIGTGSILAQFATNLPVIVIGIILGNADAGVYSAAMKLVFFLLMVDRVLGTILLPASSRIHTFATSSLPPILTTALRWLIIVALPICVGGTLLAGRLLPLIFGEQYIAAADVFRILVWYFFFTLLHTIYTTGLIAIGQEKLYTQVMVVSAIIYTVTIVLLTLLYGIAGTAVGSVASEAVTLILMSKRLSRFMIIERPRALGQIIVASVLMGVIVYFLPIPHVIPLVIVGGILYGVFLAGSRAVTFRDVTDLLRRVG